MKKTIKVKQVNFDGKRVGSIIVEVKAEYYKNDDEASYYEYKVDDYTILPLGDSKGVAWDDVEPCRNLFAKALETYLEPLVVEIGEYCND